MTEHYQKSNIECPHCDHQLDHDDMLEVNNVDLFALAPNEETASITCPACGQAFWVKGGYKPHYSTSFAEELL